MNQPNSDRDNWKLTEKLTGVCLAIATLFVGIHLVEQVFSRSPWTVTRGIEILQLSVALLYVPLTWIVIRKECKVLQRISIGDNRVASEAEVLKTVRKSMTTILSVNSFAILLLVMAFHDLLKR